MSKLKDTVINATKLAREGLIPLFDIADEGGRVSIRVGTLAEAQSLQAVAMKDLANHIMHKTGLINTIIGHKLHKNRNWVTKIVPRLEWPDESVVFSFHLPTLLGLPTGTDLQQLIKGFNVLRSVMEDHPQFDLVLEFNADGITLFDRSQTIDIADLRHMQGNLRSELLSLAAFDDLVNVIGASVAENPGSHVIVGEEHLFSPLYRPHQNSLIKALAEKS